MKLFHFNMELTRDLLAEIFGETNAKKFFDHLKSDYQKKLEKSGWEFVINHGFYSMLDDLENVEQVFGKRMVLRGRSLRERMKLEMERFRKNYSADKVRFARAYDIFGERIPNGGLVAGVYIRRKFS